MNARIAVDFDGTIFVQNEDGDIVPAEGVVDALQHLRDEGHYILIHSCRSTVGIRNDNLKDELREMRRLLAHYKVPYDEIYAGPKAIVDIYIDDRNVCFDGDWQRALADVKQALIKISGR